MEDKQFFANFAHRFDDEALPSLWKKIAPLLPKARKKSRMNTRCCGPTVSDLASHFESLEGGFPITQQALVQQCSADQTKDLSEAPLAIDLRDIPSRCAVEAQVRRMKNGRAAGLDGISPELLKLLVTRDSSYCHSLFAKCWMLGTEPVMWKGGLMHAIQKKVGSCEAHNSRGIMILTTIGKTFHGLVRHELIQWVEAHRLCTQFGGFKHLQTAFASLLLRAHCNLSLSHHFSLGVVFLDLKSAFHRLLREHTFGGSAILPPALTALLEHEGFTTQDLQLLCEDHAEPFLSSVKPHVARLVQETHRNTWFALRDDHDLHATTRGSRRDLL